MSDMNELLREADELGILNIDVDNNCLTSDILQIAINATKRLNSELDDVDIAKKIQGAVQIDAIQ